VEKYYIAIRYVILDDCRSYSDMLDQLDEWCTLLRHLASAFIGPKGRKAMERRGDSGGWLPSTNKLVGVGARRRHNLMAQLGEERERA
jgi:hypothetical protein